MKAAELREMERRGEHRLQQMRIWHGVDHAFTPHKQDNQCDKCGREQEYLRHTSNVQGRLI